MNIPIPNLSLTDAARTNSAAEALSGLGDDNRVFNLGTGSGNGASWPWIVAGVVAVLWVTKGGR